MSAFLIGCTSEYSEASWLKHDQCDLCLLLCVCSLLSVLTSSVVRVLERCLIHISFVYVVVVRQWMSTIQESYKVQR